MKKYNPDMQAKSYNLSKRLHIGVTLYINPLYHFKNF
jgi:hypothetical protein